MSQEPINLDKPRWDQSTYKGRAKHFLLLTNPLNVFASDKSLDEAKQIVDEFRRTNKMPHGYDEDKLWATKYLYDSAFHPDTGEKMVAIGRMSAQAPMNTLVTGCMITFYKTKPAIMFWQWINQTFNAVVNYTNRSGDAPITTKQLFASYCAACGGALSTALYLNSKVKKMNPLFARLVPFAAVCGANFINIPMMRSNELINGTPVFTPDGERVGDSKVAARLGIFLVCISRVGMAVPGMTLTPVITEYATKRGMFKKFPLSVIPFQLGLVGLCVTFATPLCCALFEQTVSLSIDSLEPDLKVSALKKDPELTQVFFNKALVPVITNTVVKRGLFCHYPLAVIPFQLILVAFCVTFATPLCCAFFEQRANLNINSIETNLKEIVVKKSPKTTEVFFNKALVPVITNTAVQRGLFCHYPLAVIPFQVTLVGMCAIFVTPLCCAIFEQRANLNIDSIEPNLKEIVVKKSPKTTQVFFNKGL